MGVDYAKLYKNLLEIEISNSCPKYRRGRPSKITFEKAFDGIQTIIHTGMPWRCLKCHDVAHITVFKTLHKWISVDAFSRSYTRLLKLYSLKRRPKHYAIDSTFIKNMYGRDSVGRNPTDRGRKATKMTVTVDDIGVPHAFLFSGANVSDFKLLDKTLDSAMVPLVRGTPLYADKGYDSKYNHALSSNKYGLCDRLFRRRSINTRRTHAKRGIVERFFAWNDKQRRLLVRYEQKIATYAAFMYVHSGLLLAKRLGSEKSMHGAAR